MKYYISPCMLLFTNTILIVGYFLSKPGVMFVRLKLGFEALLSIVRGVDNNNIIGLPQKCRCFHL